jgi:hypothetical protein
MISTSITCGKKPLSQTAKSILDQTPHSKIINLGVMNKHQNSVSGISQRDEMMLKMQGKKGLYAERCKVLGIQRGKKN